MIKLSQLKLGDEVLLYAPSRFGGLATGWYIVQKLGVSAAAVLPSDLNPSQSFAVHEGDFIAVRRPLAVDVEALPPAKPMDLDTPRTPMAEPAPRRPEPTPGRPETVYVINRSHDVELWSRYFGRTVHYAAGAVVDRRKGGQLVRAFEGIDSHDVDQFMHDLQPQAYLPGHEPAEFALTASDDDRPEPDRRPLEQLLAIPTRESRANPAGKPPAPQSGAPRRPRSGAPGKEN